MVGMNRSILGVDILSCFCWLGVPFFWFLLAILEFRKVELPYVGGLQVSGWHRGT